MRKGVAPNTSMAPAYATMSWFEAALVAAGLPAAELIAGVADPEVKAGLVANTEAAVARGVFGIPSFFLGEELYFGKDRLRDVVEAAQ